MPIGAVCEIFDLPPSTLHWWEKRGLLAPSRLPSGHRAYATGDLRTIALVLVFRSTGRLSLNDAACLLGARGSAGEWQDMVRQRIAEADRCIVELSSARAYLMHLLRCEHQTLAQCPLLDDELRRYGPWHPSVGIGRAVMEGCDETRDESRDGNHGESVEGGRPDPAPPVAHLCRQCGEPVDQRRTGRPRVYCSRTCRQRAYRARRAPSRPRA